MEVNEIVFNFIGQINNGTIKSEFGKNKKFVVLDPTAYELDFLQLVTYDELYDVIYFSSEIVTPNMEYIGAARLKEKVDQIDYAFFNEKIILKYIKFIELFKLKANRKTFIEFWQEQSQGYMIKLDVADFINQEVKE